MRQISECPLYNNVRAFLIYVNFSCALLRYVHWLFGFFSSRKFSRGQLFVNNIEKLSAILFSYTQSDTNDSYDNCYLRNTRWRTCKGSL